MLSKRTIAISAFVLLSTHAAALAFLGPKSRGAFVSDVIQLALGVLVILACLHTSERSESVERYF